ncbi:hypothetical protein P7C70_g7491, partial [Phenoliferia sp. Uapishka_3]
MSPRPTLCRLILERNARRDYPSTSRAFLRRAKPRTPALTMEARRLAHAKRRIARGPSPLSEEVTNLLSTLEGVIGKSGALPTLFIAREVQNLEIERTSNSLRCSAPHRPAPTRPAATPQLSYQARIQTIENDWRHYLNQPRHSPAAFLQPIPPPRGSSLPPLSLENVDVVAEMMVRRAGAAIRRGIDEEAEGEGRKLSMWMKMKLPRRDGNMRMGGIRRVLGGVGNSG